MCLASEYAGTSADSLCHRACRACLTCAAGASLGLRCRSAAPARLPQVALFDVQQRTTVAEVATPPVKYAVWSGDMNRVALLR